MEIIMFKNRIQQSVFTVVVMAGLLFAGSAQAKFNFESVKKGLNRCLESGKKQFEVTKQYVKTHKLQTGIAVGALSLTVVGLVAYYAHAKKKALNQLISNDDLKE